jgi:hypothetical protein
LVEPWSSNASLNVMLSKLLKMTFPDERPSKPRTNLAEMILRTQDLGMGLKESACVETYGEPAFNLQ